MPFLYWLDDERYTISTQWSKNHEDEFEEEAKIVDRLLDEIFDESLITLSKIKKGKNNYKDHKEFFRDYAVGRSIIESGILEHEYIIGDGTKSKPPELLTDTGNFEMIVEKGQNIAFLPQLERKPQWENH